MNPFEFEEAWYGYNMWEHVEYRLKPESDDNTSDSLPDNVGEYAMTEYQPSREKLGKIRVSVNSQVYRGSNGLAVAGNWLSNTEEMSEFEAMRIAKPFIAKGIAVMVVPICTSENEGRVNPNPSGKRCYWEWRSIDGEPFKLCIFEY